MSFAKSFETKRKTTHTRTRPKIDCDLVNIVINSEYMRIQINISVLHSDKFTLLLLLAKLIIATEQYLIDPCSVEIYIHDDPIEGVHKAKLIIGPIFVRIDQSDIYLYANWFSTQWHGHIKNVICKSLNFCSRTNATENRMWPTIGWLQFMYKYQTNRWSNINLHFSRQSTTMDGQQQQKAAVGAEQKPTRTRNYIHFHGKTLIATLFLKVMSSYEQLTSFTQ